jgi:large subunit ribosomal protein L25
MKNSKQIAIQAFKREPGKKVLNNLREEKKIPAILYGPKIEPISIYFEPKEAKHVEDESHKASVLSLTLDGEKKERNVIIQDLEYHSIKDNLLHIDLYEVDMTKEIETTIPLIFEGNAPAVKDLGGVLVKYIDEVDVKCLPKDLVESFTINLEVLKDFDTYIYIKDIKTNPNIKILNQREDIIAAVSPPRTEKEMEELDQEETEDVSKVEGVEDKKEESEGETDKEAKDSKDEKEKQADKK